jgi:hypothetical protein
MCSEKMKREFQIELKMFELGGFPWVAIALCREALGPAAPGHASLLCGALRCAALAEQTLSVRNRKIWVL